MAIKIATRLTMSKANLAKALVAKTTPLYAKETTYGPYNYERDIYPQARLAFPKYNIYNTNEDFTKYFVRDLNRKDLQLLKQIEVGAEENQISADQSNQETGAEQISAAQQTPTTGPSGGGMPSLPSTPVIHNVPQINLPGKPPEEPIGPATTKIDRLNAQQAAQNTRPSVVPGPTKKTFNFPAFKSSASSNFRKIQSFASPAGPFLKTNLSRITEGLKGMAGGMGKAITGPGLTKIANLGGRAGLGTINHGGNFLNNLSNTKSRFSAASRSLSPKNLGSKRVAWIFAGIFFLILFMGLFGGLTGTPPGETAPITLPNPNPITGDGGDIASCKFTRSGSSYLIKSSILRGWMSQAAATAGIPVQILASVAMHESQDFTANADNNHDAIKANQYCKKGLIFCEDGKGHVLHSKAEEGKDDPCTAGEIANGARNAQAVGLMQFLDIYNPGKDLCSITESLNLAATKLKFDGITSQPTQDQVNKAINAYHGCNYGSYSYCDEVWQDLQNCQPKSSQPAVPPGAPEYTDKIDLANKIKELFNVTITNPTAFTTQHLEDIYKTLAMLYQSGKFAEIMRTIAPNITLNNSVSPCYGFVDGGQTGKTVNLGPCGTFNSVAYTLPHELGHTIQNSKEPNISYIYTKYLSSVAYEYRNNLIYTYPRYVTGDELISENFAEMITNSFRGPLYKLNYTKADFIARYRSLYDFAILEVFGGVEFN